MGRFVPFVRPKPQHHELNIAEEINVAVRADALIETPDRPPPTSFEEVGEQLNILRRKWNSHEKEFLARAEIARKEANEVKEAADARAAAIEHAFETQVIQAVRERRREACLLVAGGGLQVVGAVILLVAV